MFKNRPLSFHNRAMPTAKASIAAHKQGKFWEFHDKMFANQQKLEDADLEGYAKEVGLDVAKWKADLASKEVEALVKRQDSACEKNGSAGTPGFFVNGRYLSGALPFEEFKAVIEDEKKKAEAAIAKGGTTRDDYYAKLIADAKKAARKSSGLEGPVNKFALDDSPVFGPNKAIATLVIFSEFQ